MNRIQRLIASLGIVAFVAAESDSSRKRFSGEHFQRAVSFRRPAGLCQADIHHQSVAVFGKNMAQIAKACLLSAVRSNRGGRPFKTGIFVSY